MSKNPPSKTPEGRTMSGPVVAVDIDGKRAAWCDGFFTGDPDIIAKAKWAALVSWPVSWGRLPEPTTADDTTPLGALAALMVLDPDRALITAWPVDLREMWEREHHACGLERGAA